MSTQLTTQQASALRLLEQQIQTGGESIRQAFLKIRDQRLYIAHGTFANYCKERWNIKARHGYQLAIEGETQARLAAESQTTGGKGCAAVLHNPPTHTGRTLTSLAKVPAEHQAEVAEALEEFPDINIGAVAKEIKAGTKPQTAIKRAIKESAPKPNGKPKKTKEPAREATPEELAKGELKVLFDAVARWMPTIDNHRRLFPGAKGDRVIAAAKELYEATKAWHSSIK